MSLTRTMRTGLVLSAIFLTLFCSYFGSEVTRRAPSEEMASFHMCMGSFRGIIYPGYTKNASDQERMLDLTKKSQSAEELSIRLQREGVSQSLMPLIKSIYHDHQIQFRSIEIRSDYQKNLSEMLIINIWNNCKIMSEKEKSSYITNAFIEVIGNAFVALAAIWLALIVICLTGRWIMRGS